MIRSSSPEEPVVAVQLHTPALFVERDLDRLVGALPNEAIEEVRKHWRTFKSWVAEPALRQATVDEAVMHVLRSAGTAAQFKVAVLDVLAGVPGGVEAFLAAAAEHLDEVPGLEDHPALAKAVDFLQAAQRSWFRFIQFHPASTRYLDSVDPKAIGRLIDDGFTADNVLTVVLVGLESTPEVPRPILDGLAEAAEEWATRYYVAVRELIEAAGPAVDDNDPFRKRSLDDLMALPPFDGPAVTLEEMEEAIEDRFETP